MTKDTYQLLYCSRNCIHGTPFEVADEIGKILSVSRTNNVEAAVTGALIFNTVLFAQVLEGPLDGVERIFEQIQRDLRHSDLMVLESGLVAARDFPKWSMAFAGATSEESHPLIAATLNDAVMNPSLAGKQVITLLRDLVLQEEDWALPTHLHSPASFIVGVH
jgi:hypothetical protein